MSEKKGLTKKGLSEAVSITTGMTKKDAGIAIDSVTKAIETALSYGEEVALHGFGTFKVMHRKERKGINPATKEQVIYPAKTVVAFKPAKTLKDAVENGKA